LAVRASKATLGEIKKRRDTEAKEGKDGKKLSRASGRLQNQDNGAASQSDVSAPAASATATPPAALSPVAAAPTPSAAVPRSEPVAAATITAVAAVPT